MKILVLYEELALYLINGFNVAAEKNNWEILIISKKINSVAPFKFDSVHENITIKEREAFSEEQLLSLVKEFKPDLVFLGGWIHKPYLKIVKSLNVKTVIAFDNQWKGTLRQILGCLYFKLNLKKYISNAFVAGQKQFDFAKHLGFSESTITKGLYCCDFSLFSSYSKLKTQKDSTIPKRFLYVGRYAHEKGIEDLWKAFIQMQTENPSDWELWCLGKGSMSPVDHPKIKHFGFLQPNEMANIIKDTGVFVLPSLFEPWGVVVHEYAAAGFPILCSNEVGAIDSFLVENSNGFTFTAGNVEQLKQKLNKFTLMPNADLVLMSQKSFELASKLTPEIWADKLMRIINL
ncbi:MAG TPA: glycosyltransferase family 4 protein [Bacteroidia bacterium]|jgi:glycosyltransferase involved in cell wall biosynthesis|nr:glycosyltransferase family 4 protein [Bacteroidia bacterium]